MVKKIINALRRRLFPTPDERMVDKWFADGGDERFRFDYALTQNSLVLDLGGYKGQWTSDIFSRYRCNIIIFEPVKKFAQGIEKRFERNDKIYINYFGLGGYSRKETINLCDDGSSIFRNSSESEEIMIIDIKEWIDKNDIQSIDLMKINIEGGEYELIERLIDTKLIGLIENIQIQFHNITNESGLQMECIQKRLEETHILTYQYRFVWENWKKINNL